MSLPAADPRAGRASLKTSAHVQGRDASRAVIMLGQKQDPFADDLICRKAGGGERGDSAAMSNRIPDPATTVLCPACARTMVHVRTIWRAFQDDLQVFECRACNLSVSTKAVPPKSE